MMNQHKLYFKQGGATLLEVMAGMVIIGIIAAGTLRIQANDARNAVIDNALVQTIALQNAARQHRAETGSWPSNTSQLVSSGKITSANATSPFGTSYTLSVTGNNLRVSATALNASQARRMAGMLPTGSVTGSTYSFQFQPAGSEASLAGLYSLDGARGLTGSMNANGHNISNINSLNGASVFGTTVTGGTINSNGDISAAGRITANGVMTANGGFTTTGNINGGIISGASFNGGSFNGGNVNSNGTVTANLIRSYGNVEGANVIASGALSGNTINSTGNITAGGQLNAGSIFTSGNIQTWGNLSANGNIHANDMVVRGYMYSRRFVDYEDNAYSLDLNAQNRIANLEVTNDVRFTNRYAAGGSCNFGQIGFDSLDTLLTCKNGIWTSTEGTGVIQYTNATQSSYTLGNMIIKYGKVNADDGGVRTMLFTEPFPPDFINFTCQITVEAYDHGGSAFGCRANSTTLFTKNGNANQKDVNWLVIGLRP